MKRWLLRRLLPAAALLCAQLPAGAVGEYVRQDAVGLEVRVPQRPTWIATRGGHRALYELRIENLRSQDLVLDRVEVVVPGSGAVLLSLDGTGLVEAIARRGWSGPEEEKALWRGGQSGMVFVELAADGSGGMPQTIAHRLYVSTPEPDADGARPRRQWMLETLPVDFVGPPLALAAPLRGTGWLAGNAPSNDSDHRRALIPVNGRAGIAQRYAIDWVRIGPNGRLTRDDSGSNASYFGYGEPVLAAADGRIASVKDGIPENTPFSTSMAVPITLDTAAGNFVLLDTGGAFVVYAHLQPGSIRVAAGSRVRRGDVIARVGNSGQSDAPHLHLHVSDTAGNLAGEGLPYVLEAFRYLGSLGDLDAWLESDQAWHASETTASPRRRELPLDGDVVEFPR